MAESILARQGGGKLGAFSAGSNPTGILHPMALEVLSKQGCEISGLRSKSWEEFAEAEAPTIDFVFTVCDSARGERCPIWPGRPISAHWGVEDPAAFRGSRREQRDTFARTYAELERRIQIFLQLDMEGLDRVGLTERLQEIGKISPLHGIDQT